VPARVTQAIEAVDPGRSTCSTELRDRCIGGLLALASGLSLWNVLGAADIRKRSLYELYGRMPCGCQPADGANVHWLRDAWGVHNRDSFVGRLGCPYNVCA